MVNDPPSDSRLYRSASPRAPVVLVVDDQPMVLRVVQRMLARLGLRTLTASSGAEALERLQAHEGPMDLLLTDVRMPGFDGVELAHRVWTDHPDLPVLFMSAYSVYVEADEVPGPLLGKPFARGDLERQVLALLSPSARHAAD